MTTFEKSARSRDLKGQPFSRNGNLDALLGRIDLMAILTTLLGLSLLGVAALALAVFELTKLLSTLWSDPVERWLILALGLSAVWVVARWKRLCIF